MTTEILMVHYLLLKADMFSVRTWKNISMQPKSSSLRLMFPIDMCIYVILPAQNGIQLILL